MRSGPYSGKPCTYLPDANAASASSRQAVFAPLTARGRASGSRPCSSCCFLLYPSCAFCRKGKKTSLHPRKGTKARKLALRLTTRYCVPAYAASITAKLPSAPTVSRREGFGLQLRSDIRSRPTCTGFHHTRLASRSVIGTYCLHHHLSWMKLCAERGFRHFSPSCVPLSPIIGKCLSAVNRHFAQKQMFLCGGHYQTPPRPVMSHGAGSASKLCLAFILETVI